MNFVAGLPAAGAPSSRDQLHDYPYSRSDSSSFAAPGSNNSSSSSSGDRHGGGHPRPHTFSSAAAFHDSSAVRNAITGRTYLSTSESATTTTTKNSNMHTSRAMVKPAYALAETPEDYARLAATRNRATYDAASFCVEGPRRRLKSGPGWEGPAAYRNGERPAANPALYSTHRFHTKSHHKPSVRAGTDGMLRSLGFHHVADTAPAGAPSRVGNRYIDDSAAMNRGPAMTVNSQIMRPSRNPLTGHNMGDEYKYAPGERRISRKRMGQQSDTEFHMRRGQVGDVTTHTRMFGETYVERPQASGLRTQFGGGVPDAGGSSGSGRGSGGATVGSGGATVGSGGATVGSVRHDGRDAASSIFPQSALPIDHDRRQDQAQYQQRVWKMHESLPGFREAAMIKAKYGY
jgi:hypothetical protein